MRNDTQTSTHKTTKRATMATTATTTLPLPVAGESELIARLAELSPTSVAVVEVFSEAWGPCKSVDACYKRLRADHDDPALSILSVAAERLASASAPANNNRPSAAGTAPAKAALATIAARQGNSEPLFVVFKGGVLRESVRGADPPRLTAVVEGLLPPPAAGAGAGAAAMQRKEQQQQEGGRPSEDDDAGAAGAAGTAGGGAGGAAEAANPFKALLLASGGGGGGAH